MIKPLKGSDRVYDWYLKANEIISALNELEGAKIPHVNKGIKLDNADELTNAIIEKVNDLNRAYPLQ